MFFILSFMTWCANWKEVYQFNTIGNLITRWRDLKFVSGWYNSPMHYLDKHSVNYAMKWATPPKNIFPFFPTSRPPWTQKSLILKQPVVIVVMLEVWRWMTFKLKLKILCIFTCFVDSMLLSSFNSSYPK